MEARPDAEYWVDEAVMIQNAEAEAQGIQYEAAKLRAKMNGGAG